MAGPSLFEKLFPGRKDYHGKSWPAISIGLFVAFGGILFGYDTGTISGILAMPYFMTEFSTGFENESGDLDLTSSQTSLVVSILSAGTFFGALSSPFFSDYIGRKWAIFASCWVFNLGVVFQTAATDLPLFNAGRFFAGMGVGQISAMIPLYQSETAPKWIRGFIVGAYQLAITLGILLAAIFNNATKDMDNSGSYRIPIAIQFLWSLILMIGMLILPETPRYLVKRDRREDAKASLAKLRRVPVEDPAIETELQEIEANHKFEMSIGNATYLDCFKGTMGKRQLTGMALQMFQQLTGVNFIFYYGTTYFKNAGVSNPFVIQMITCAVNTLSTFPGILAVDKVGRRPLLLMGAIGMAASQFIVAMCGHFSAEQSDTGDIIVTNLAAQKASIAFVCIFIFFFASTWGPLAWIICGELFPLKFRARALSITTATNWLWNWAIAYSTPYLVDYGDGNANLQSKIFFIWFACCFLCIGFTWFFIYETKGHTLEDIDQMYEDCKSARASSSWQPTESWVHRTHAGEKTEAVAETEPEPEKTTPPPVAV